jgi:anti-sigma-K factor RskA
MAKAFDDKKAAEREVARLTAALADAEERVRLAEQAEARLAKELEGAQKQIESYRQIEAKAAMRAEKTARKAEKKALWKNIFSNRNVWIFSAVVGPIVIIFYILLLSGFLNK